MKSRELVHQEALKTLELNGFNGTIVLSTGTGKSKIAIDAIRKANFKRILITGPRENLKKSWLKELEKWGIKSEFKKGFSDYGESPFVPISREISIENIQSAYTYTENALLYYDLIIVDEIHTVGIEYSKYIEIFRKYKKPVIGLTATPNLKDTFKRNVLYGELVPIVYQYLRSEEDMITNSIRYFVLEYELTNTHKVLVKTKNKQWYEGEKKRYDYLEQKYEEAKGDMYRLGASEYFETSLQWMRTGNAQQKKAGAKFFYAIKNRKEFLWSMTSSAVKAVAFKNIILKNPENKVLLFSELTAQADRLSIHSVHSKNGDSAKKVKENNALLLDDFNKGVIRELSSCLSLTLGLNLEKANWAIFESYSSSQISSKQRRGRLHRLPVDEVANVIIIKPVDTQAQSWFENAFNWLKEYIVIKNVTDIEEYV